MIISSGTRNSLNGGVLWRLKSKDGFVNDIHVTVELRKQQASHWPFSKPNLHTSFRPDRIAVETSGGQVEQERLNPCESLKGHVLETPQHDLHLEYFAGYAMWTYLNMPFLFAVPGTQTEEIQPWQENAEAWRRLRVTFSPSISSHSAVQTFYFERNGLLKRHDYDVDVSILTGSMGVGKVVTTRERKERRETSIYAIHAHGDHFFRATVLSARFPKARFVAAPSAIQVVKEQVSPSMWRSFGNWVFRINSPSGL